MLFMCHQLAMKQEADDKLKAEKLHKAHSCVDVPIIWVLGGPGSGKGTQCAKVVEKYGFIHLSTGDLLRAEVDSGSDNGKKFQEIMASGKLVPNEDVLGLLEKAIDSHKSDAKGFLIDGYPREHSQGQRFEDRIAPADLVIYLEASNDTMCKRISGRAANSVIARADDNEDTIKMRLETFSANTNAILNQYVDKTLTVNAERDIDEIFDEISITLDCIIARKKKGREML